MQTSFVVVVVVVLAAVCEVYSATVSPYCAVCPNHTMCNFPVPPPAVGPACKPKITGGIPTAAEQAIILDVHNAERSLVAMGLEKRGKPGPQPGAANMAKLVWNNELATIAQRWADQCTYKHDTCRNLLNKTPAGQNLYISMSTSTATTSNWKAAVTAWIDEVSLFNNADVSPFKFLATTGHYSQVVWATTTAVGCARSVFKDGTKPTTGTTLWTKSYYVCNYASAGNSFVNGVGTMYIKGVACASCPTGMKVCSKTAGTYKGLCSA